MSYQKIQAFLNQTEIRELQERKLRELILYLKQNSPYYQRIFNLHKINPMSIRSLQDLTQLPFTTKEDLQLYNDEFLCVAKESVLEYTSTSGTLGTPVTIALTEKDLQRLALNEFGSFTCAGATPHDIFQLMLTLDRQFMAGMAYYSGSVCWVPALFVWGRACLPCNGKRYSG